YAGSNTFEQWLAQSIEPIPWQTNGFTDIFRSNGIYQGHISCSGCEFTVFTIEIEQETDLSGFMRNDLYTELIPVTTTDTNDLNIANFCCFAYVHRIVEKNGIFRLGSISILHTLAVFTDITRIGTTETIEGNIKRCRLKSAVIE